MFDLLDYGSIVSSQKYYIGNDHKFITKMSYKNFEKNIDIDIIYDGNVNGYIGEMKINNKLKSIAMRSLDNPLQRYIMKYNNTDNPTPITFFRYDTAKEKDKDDCGFLVSLIDTGDKRKDFLLSISKFHTVGIDKNNYAAIYNTRNRIYEKYYVLDNNNIGYYTCNDQEIPTSFTFYSSEKYKLTNIELQNEDIPYYMISPEWYSISEEDNMRIRSDKFNVIYLKPSDNISMSFGPIGFDPFDLNNNNPDDCIWFFDKLEDSKSFQRNIFRIDKEKEESLYKKLEDFYIVKSS